MRTFFSFYSFFTLIISLLLLGCSKDTPLIVDEEPVPINPNTEFDAVGTASTLDLVTWNLEWFGDTSRGPNNEDLQLSNMDFVISGLDLDIWSVQEVTDSGQFNSLLDSLDGYDGFLANDSFVEQGPEFYSDFGGNEQKVGLIYKSDLISVSAAKVILTDYDHEFAGRPPVEVQLTATIDNVSEELVVILLHAKCCTDADEWTRRRDGSLALKSYLDSTWPTASVTVMGDFNDDLDESIRSSEESPYMNFLSDTAAYSFPTLALSEAGISSTVFYPDVIDHHLNSNEWMERYIANSVQVFKADDYVVNYAETTSDHYPVITQYNLSGN